MTLKPPPQDACQRCFQARQGLVPLSDLVRELRELGIGVLVCRSCMKEMVAVSNFLSFQGVVLAPHPMMVQLSQGSQAKEVSDLSGSLSSYPSKPTLDMSKTIIRHDNDALEGPEATVEPSLKKEPSKTTSKD